MRQEILLTPLCALLLLLLPGFVENRRHYRRYKPHNYQLTLSIRFFLLHRGKRLQKPTMYVLAFDYVTVLFQVTRKGYWTLFVEFPNDRYAKSPRKLISRDSFGHFILEVCCCCLENYHFVQVYYYPGSVGFSEWHKMRRRRFRHYRVID
ncbi:hypothetical protein M3Y98_00145700 [Aphelenchoides besseyi]|nr:hypothetical protein M3Y98_00145700 [Aphelenchoides besseyi]